MFDFAKSIGADWKELALMMGVTPVDVECIERDVSTTRERAFRMLRDWYWKVGKQADLHSVRAKLEIIRSEKQARQEARELFVVELRYLFIST